MGVSINMSCDHSTSSNFNLGTLLINKVIEINIYISSTMVLWIFASLECVDSAFSPIKKVKYPVGFGHNFIHNVFTKDFAQSCPR